MVQNTFTIAEIELTYKPSQDLSNRPKICTPGQAYDLFMQHWNLGKIGFVEEFKILLLNRKNRVLGIVSISQGGVTGTIADPKVIFAVALKACASYIVLCHNHPSGELDPSSYDIKLTKRLREGAALLEMKIFDHLIISANDYFSFGDAGLMG